jgi:hypothetical protein
MAHAWGGPERALARGAWVVRRCAWTLGPSAVLRQWLGAGAARGPGASRGLRAAVQPPAARTMVDVLSLVTRR